MLWISRLRISATRFIRVYVTDFALSRWGSEGSRPAEPPSFLLGEFPLEFPQLLVRGAHQSADLVIGRGRCRFFCSNGEQSFEQRSAPLRAVGHDKFW